MKIFKRILAGILTIIIVYGISSFSSIKAKENDELSNTIEGIEKEALAPKAPLELASETVKIAAALKTTPEPKFYYSKFIHVLVTQSEKDKIEQLLLNYEEEIIMLSKLIYREARRSIIPLQEKAAVVWTVLNRFDSDESEYYGGSIKGIITKKHQYAWVYNTPSEDWYWLAKDVITRWLLEKEGFENVGRVIPKEYEFFSGWDDKHNHFRTEYRSKDYWDWSLPDPYKDLPYPDDLSVIIDMFAEEQIVPLRTLKKEN